MSRLGWLGSSGSWDRIRFRCASAAAPLQVSDEPDLPDAALGLTDLDAHKFNVGYAKMPGSALADRWTGPGPSGVALLAPAVPDRVSRLRHCHPFSTKLAHQIIAQMCGQWAWLAKAGDKAQFENRQGW